MAITILMTTSTFAEYSRTPLDLLEKHHIQILMNPTGKIFRRHALNKTVKVRVLKEIQDFTQL